MRAKTFDAGERRLHDAMRALGEDQHAGIVHYALPGWPASADKAARSFRVARAGAEAGALAADAEVEQLVQTILRVDGLGIRAEGREKHPLCKRGPSPREGRARKVHRC